MKTRAPLVADVIGIICLSPFNDAVYKQTVKLNTRHYGKFGRVCVCVCVCLFPCLCVVLVLVRMCVCVCVLRMERHRHIKGSLNIQIQIFVLWETRNYEIGITSLSFRCS